MSKISGIILAFFLALLLISPVFAQVPVDICPTTEPGKTLCEFGKNPEAFQRLVRFIIATAFVIAVLIALFFLIFGGIRWILSGGDKTAVENARNTIVAAVVGLAIITIAFVIINIIGTVFGINLFQLTIPKI